jgi:uncharacterized membrane protein (DUF485 family)
MKGSTTTAIGIAIVLGIALFIIAHILTNL